MNSPVRSMVAPTQLEIVPNPELSVVVPTYREALNLTDLARALDKALSAANLSYELIIVDDDSPDDTAEIHARLACEYPITLITRQGVRGLSSAVLEGCHNARGQYLVIMDGDLSHPADAIPSMIQKLKQGSTDFVSGSRYVASASVHTNWNWFRRLNSRIPSWLSRPLSPLKDPMSGFFALNRDHLPDSMSLSPVGYKIGLEILVKGNFKQPTEVPIHFAERKFGESKLTFTEQLRFLQHVRRLYHFRYPVLSEFFQFGIVGASGFVIDLLFYFALQMLGLSHTSARAGSFVVAASWNWIWNRLITFSDRGRVAKLIQWPSFLMTSTLGFVINWGSYTLLTSHLPFFDSHRVLALVAGVLAGMAFNFVLVRLFVFRPFAENVARQ